LGKSFDVEKTPTFLDINMYGTVYIVGKFNLHVYTERKNFQQRIVETGKIYTPNT